MLLSPKPVLCRRLLNSLRKRRPAEEEHHFLLWETTVVCDVWNFVPRTCFSPQSRWAHTQCSMCVLIFLPRAPAFTFPLACLSCIHFSWYPLIEELARKLQHNVCVSCKQSAEHTLAPAQLSYIPPMLCDRFLSKRGTACSLASFYPQQGHSTSKRV